MSNFDKLVEETGVMVFDVAPRAGSNVRSFSLVFHDCGKRVKLSNRLYADLGSPEQLQFKINVEKGLVLISGRLDRKRKGFPVNHPKNVIIYSSALAGEIVKTFNLDFTDISSLTFTNIDVGTLNDGTPVAAVWIVDNRSADSTEEAETETDSEVEETDTEEKPRPKGKKKGTNGKKKRREVVDE